MGKIAKIFYCRESFEDTTDIKQPSQIYGNGSGNVTVVTVMVRHLFQFISYSTQVK